MKDADFRTRFARRQAKKETKEAVDASVERARAISKAVGGTVKQVGTIDLTPTWAAVLPILIEAMTNGTPESAKIAREELSNMAKAADLYNKSVPK